MIKQLTEPYPYSPEELNCIELAGNNWYSGRNCIKAIKANLNSHLDSHQEEKCCYCGLTYGETGRGEVEHIAAQGAESYPQFSYTTNNLAKACQLCNSSSMKHTFDSVELLSVNYVECEFRIVHPYLHDPTEHYSWKYGVLISVNNDSPQARESIRLFELDSEKRTRARAKQRNQEKIENLFNVGTGIKNRILSVLRFRV